MPSKQAKTKKKKKILYFLLSLLLIMTIAGYYANSFVTKKGYKNLWQFITTTGSNYSKSFNAEYEKIYINIADSDFQKLKSKRDAFLEQGIITNDGNRYVDAYIIHNNNKIKCKLRLKGHMTDHLQEKKWSFRIKTKGKDALMGMNRFTLQHPGTRAYAYEWVYHQWLKYENIFHLRYFFLKVFVNNEDWGIYALEEHFSKELLHYNKKQLGPILRFNPDMYWHSRISEKNNINIDEQFASLQSSYIEAYNESDLLKTHEGKTIYNKSVQLLEEFRRRKKTTSEVFDIEKMAKFHAIIDLIGGQHSLDWSDVKYYYNPNSNKLEPVGYESFSVNKITQISGANKYLHSYANYDNIHEMIFSDSAFFSSYIHYLNAFSRKEYLDKFFNDINISLNQQLSVLYTEFPYKNFDTKTYYQNAETINKILNSPASVEAHLQKITNDTIYLNVACIDALPYLAGDLFIDTFVYHPAYPTIIPSKKLNKPTEFITLKYIINNKFISNFNKLKKMNIRLHNKLLGNHLFDTLWRETNVLLYNSYEDNSPLTPTVNINQLPYIIEDKSNMLYIIPQGYHFFKNHLYVPNTHKLLIKPGANITFEKNSSLMVKSALICNGNEENIITINFQDTITQLYITSDNTNKSGFFNCIFSSKGNTNNSSRPHINIYNTNIEINSCLFAGMSNTAIHLSNSNALFYSATFMLMFNDAIKFSYCNAKIIKSLFNKISDKSIVSVGSSLFIDNSYFNGRNSTSLTLKENTYTRINNCTFSFTDIAIKVVDGTTVYAGNIIFNNARLGILSEKTSNSYGNSYIRINNLQYSQVNQLIQKNKSTSINIIKQIEK